MKIQKKADGTFIVDFRGDPFHVCSEYPTKEQYGVEMTFDYINEYAKAHPEDVEDYVAPVSVDPVIPEEEKKAIEISNEHMQAMRLLPAIQAGIDVGANQQKLVDIMLEIEELQGNIEQ